MLDSCTCKEIFDFSSIALVLQAECQPLRKQAFGVYSSSVDGLLEDQICRTLSPDSTTPRLTSFTDKNISILDR